jgi:hypothetical protein
MKSIGLKTEIFAIVTGEILAGNEERPMVCTIHKSLTNISIYKLTPLFHGIKSSWFS